MHILSSTSGMIKGKVGSLPVVKSDLYQWYLDDYSLRLRSTSGI